MGLLIPNFFSHHLVRPIVTSFLTALELFKFAENFNIYIIIASKFSLEAGNLPSRINFFQIKFFEIRSPQEDWKKWGRTEGLKNLKKKEGENQLKAICAIISFYYFFPLK